MLGSFLVWLTSPVGHFHGALDVSAVEVLVQVVPVLENFGPEAPETGRVLGVDPGPRLLAGLADRRELPLGGEAGLPVQVQVLIVRLKKRLVQVVE